MLKIKRTANIRVKMHLQQHLNFFAIKIIKRHFRLFYRIFQFSDNCYDK